MRVALNSKADKPVALISGSNWNLECWFLWREENRRTRRKTLGAGRRTNNKLNPHVAPGPGIEPGPQWWEASALTTAPSLLPQCTFQRHGEWQYQKQKVNNFISKYLRGIPRAYWPEMSKKKNWSRAYQQKTLEVDWSYAKAEHNAPRDILELKKHSETWQTENYNAQKHSERYDGGDLQLVQRLKSGSRRTEVARNCSEAEALCHPTYGIKRTRWWCYTQRHSLIS